MTTRRKGIIIMILSAVAVLLCAALFSVSFAKWDGGSSATQTVDGKVGQFYVDYPYTAQTSQALDADTFYLEVKNDSGISDYYPLGKSNVTTADYTISGVYLEGGKPIYFRKGQNVIAEGSLSQENAGWHGSVDATNTYWTPSFSAFFTIAFKVNNGNYSLYVNSNPLIVDLNFGGGKTITCVIDSGSVNFHLWHRAADGTDTDIIEDKWPGKACVAAGYSSTSSTADNIVAIDELNAYDINDNIYLIINYDKDGTSCQTSEINIKDTFGASDVNYIRLTEGAKKNNVIPLTINDNTAVLPPASITPVQAGEDGSDEMCVRKVTANNTNKYHNYVCVSRVAGTGSSVAYLNFEVEGGDLSAVVTGFSVKRAATDANGSPESGGAAEDEFIYNSPVGKTLAEINPAKDTRDVADNGHLNSNFVQGGTYIMLYFGDGKDKYYALDVEIETAGEASFTLTATATNIDKRHRYEVGYGEPHSYYLGGEFNGIPMWDPRYAAKLTKNSDFAEDDVPLSYVDNGVTVKYSGPSYIDITLEIELTATNDTIKLYRLNGDDGKREQGKAPTLWFIPYHIYKNYEGGVGMDGKSNLFNKDMNLIVAKPGTYEIHYQGSVTYKSDDFYAYDRTDRVYLSKTEYYALPNIDDTTYDGTQRYVILGNWNGVVENLYVIRKESDAFDKVEVTFDANGGTVDGAPISTAQVDWGKPVGAIVAKEAVNGDKSFVGWFDAPTDGNRITADTIIAPQAGKAITLYAQYSDPMPKYNVTFDVNGGVEADGVEYVFAKEEGKIIEVPTAPTPADADMHYFDGWYTEQTGGTKLGTTVTVGNSDITYYAQYKPYNIITFNVNVANGGSGDNIVHKLKADEDTVDMPEIDPAPADADTHYFDGWYTSASGGTKLTGTSVIVSASAEYFAQYKPYRTVKFDVNGGVGDSTEYTKKKDGETVAVPAAPAPIDGTYYFAGWYSAAEDGELLIAPDYDATETVTVSGDITTYFAQYKPYRTVTFDVNVANGGSGENIVLGNLKDGETVDVPDGSEPTDAEWYAFDGWYDAVTDGNKVETTFTVSGDTTYFAQYKAIKYRVVLDVSEWASYADFDYHIHAYGGTGVGTVTGTSGNEWNTRPMLQELNSGSGDGKMYYDLKTTDNAQVAGVTNITFTLDQKGGSTAVAATEFARLELSGLSLACGNTYEYEMTVANTGYRKVELNFASGSGVVFIKGVTGIRYWNCTPSNSNVASITTLPDSLTAGEYGGINMIYTSSATAYDYQTGNVWWVYGAGTVRKYNTAVWGKTYETIAINTYDSDGSLGAV